MAEGMEIAGASRSVMRASLARSGKWAGAVGAVGGFLSDVLQPLAPFAAYVALVAAVAALVVAVAIVLRLVLAASAMPALVFATTTAAIAGGVYALQQASDAEDGVIASLVPAVAELQRSVGIVSGKLDRVQATVDATQKTVEETKQAVDATKQTAADTKQSVEAVKQSTDKVEQKTEEIAQGQQQQIAQGEKLQRTSEQIAASVETIAQGFAALAAQGGVIADPKRPDEFYHNARVHELGGDMLNARRDYLAFAGFDVDAIDPYIRFATLLRVQDGRAGAREVFSTFAGKGKALSPKLVADLQYDDAQRLDRVKNFVAANPDFGPGYFLLAQEFSEDRLGFQALSDKRAEAGALTKFLSYEKDGALVKYFVDHTELAAWLDRARQRLTALGNVLDPTANQPKLTPQRSNQGWMVTVTLPEPALGISWRMGTDGAFTDTGLLALNDQRTGKPMPNPSFAIPGDATADTIGVKYRDIRGNEAGPFDIAFNPSGELAAGSKQILEQLWTSWVEFDSGGNTGLLYFTQLLSYRCGIKEVRYSLDGSEPDTVFDMPPCDEKDPYAIPYEAKTFLKVGKGVKSVSVQVTYSDDSQSPVREFKR
jgi:TolA-binding protein